MTAATTPTRPAVIAYYPGCSLHSTSREFDESLRAVAGELGIALAEIRDWSCCGASSGHTTNHLLGIALPARNLALAEAQGYDTMVAPCAACYSRLASARHAVATEAGLAERMPDILGRPFANSVVVHNVVELLRDATPRIGKKIAASASPNLLAEARLACYYGCLLIRPPEICEYDDAEQPSSMDDVVRACGADAVSWNMKVECCGAAMSISRTSSVIRLGRAIINDARANGAEAIVVACPMCHSNLDLRQKAMVERGEKPMPVLFITQVVGLAMGLPPTVLGLDRHFVDTSPLIERLTKRAAEREVAERKAAEEAAAKAAARAAKAAAKKAAAENATAEAGAAPPEGGEAQ